jgi:hypothetical protein
MSVCHAPDPEVSGRAFQPTFRFATGFAAMKVVGSADRQRTRCPAWGVAALLLTAVLAFSSLLGPPAEAQRVENRTANFAALDKVTAAVKQLPIALNHTAEFRTLKITPRACYTRDPREPPRTSTFVEVDEVMIDGKEKRIFTGWMFAESPGLNPLVHPVFDLWLTGCSQPRSPGARPESPEAGQQPSGEPPPPPPRRRVPR